MSMTDDAPAAPKLIFERWHELPEGLRPRGGADDRVPHDQLIGPVQEFRWVPPVAFGDVSPA